MKALQILVVEDDSLVAMLLVETARGNGPWRLRR
jgi:CheY-like chemotaxis protein